MTNTATKLKRALCSMVVMLALMAGISAIPAYAASPGIYTASTRCMDRWDEGSWYMIPLGTEGSPP